MELAACSWGAPGTSWGAKVGIQFAYSHSIRRMGPKSADPSVFQNKYRGEVYLPPTPLRPGPLAAKVGNQFAYSHSIDKMGPKSGPSERILPRGRLGEPWINLASLFDSRPVLLKRAQVLMDAPGEPTLGSNLPIRTLYVKWVPNLAQAKV